MQVKPGAETMEAKRRRLRGMQPSAPTTNRNERRDDLNEQLLSEPLNDPVENHVPDGSVREPGFRT